MFLPVLLLAQHPISFFNKDEAALVKNSLVKLPLLNASFKSIKKETDLWLDQDVDVPFPKDPAGGYSHEKHKANYLLMFNSAVLFNITGEQKYAYLVRNILLKYAKLNPTLKNHPQATSNSPGRIFWQALNDANWMVYTGMAYDLVYQELNPADRNVIEIGAFKPEVDFVTKDLSSWFNLIHNHAVWATAAVGIIGIATNNQAYVDLALEGSEHNGSTGFYALLSQLFSPDGYYTEGPYYTRYALLPFMIFANAINNKYPAKKIFNYRNSILKKAVQTALQYSNTDGIFFPLNDAIKDKDYTTSEMMMAVNIYTKAYGLEPAFLPVAQKQRFVLLTEGGIELAQALANKTNQPTLFPYKTIENADGANGDKGGVSILRNGTGTGLTSLIFKYSSHGLSHGHYDKLNINLFDKGNEILQDYGAARFVGVEQKYGGRYLPENAGYASQTIAHNTLVVDETSHFKGVEKTAEQFWPAKLFSNFDLPNALAIAAVDSNAYPSVQLRRSLYLLELPNTPKLLLDIFLANSLEQHQYDLPFHYLGQFIHSSFEYSYAKKTMQPLGAKNGYQYLWKEAEAKLVDTIAQFSFLNGQSYYTISTMITDTANILFARTGANDPNFNLRREPAFIIRKNGKDQSFVSVIEFHGKYDPVNEVSSGANSVIQKIRQIQNSQDYTITEIILKTGKLLVLECKTDLVSKSKHSIHISNVNLEWMGPFAVFFNGKKLNG
jgi:oligo-alginate lyase